MATLLETREKGSSSAAFDNWISMCREFYTPLSFAGIFMCSPEADLTPHLPFVRTRPKGPTCK